MELPSVLQNPLTENIMPSEVKKDEFVVRKMTREDVEQVLEVWREIGLHEGTQTIYSFMAVDPDGFAVAEQKDNGQ